MSENIEEEEIYGVRYNKDGTINQMFLARLDDQLVPMTRQEVANLSPEEREARRKIVKRAYQRRARATKRPSYERVKEKKREKWKNDPEYRAAELEKQRQKRLNNPEKWKEYHRNRKRRLTLDPEYREELTLKERDRGYRKLGSSLDEYEKMFKEQGGRCKICGTDKPGGKYGTLMLDHCHDTGRVRGLLCHGCNAGLGLIKDNPNTLRGMIKYLEDNPK